MYPPQGSGSGSGGSGSGGSAHDLGWYLTPQDLLEAFPTGSPGDYGYVSNNGSGKSTIFIWDDDIESWVDSSIEGIVSSINQEGVVETGDVKITLGKLGLHDTDDLKEGTTNKYHKQADWNITSSTDKAFIKNKPVIPVAGSGTSKNITTGALSVNVDGVTIKVNSRNELQVIGGGSGGGGGTGGSYADAAFAETPKVYSNNTIGNIEPGYELSGKCFRQIIRDMTDASVVYPNTETPYKYGLLMKMDGIVGNDITGLTGVINETKSSKFIDYGVLTTDIGFLTFAYPQSYGALESIEIGNGLMSEDISDEFASSIVATTYGNYVVYVRQLIAEIPSSYKVRFVSDEANVPYLSCTGGNDDDGMFDGGDANDWIQ